MIDVSIIFVNYNTIKLLENAIDSVFEKTDSIDYEIIVVDNNSNDDSQNIITQKYGLKVKYIKLVENIGFGRANNEGFRVAEGRNVLCLNPDTLLINNAIKILSDYLDNNVNVGVVGSQLYNVNGTIQQSFSYFFPSLSSSINDLLGAVFRKKHKQIEKPVKAASVFGASMMIKSEVIKQTNGFDPRFFMYAEEEEWCYRIKKLGYEIYCIPQSKVTHLDGGSFQFSEDREKRRMEGERKFFKITYSPIYNKCVRAVNFLTVISRITVFEILRDKQKVKYWRFRYKNFFN